MFAVGKRVRVLPPFSDFYPDEYEITGQSETGALVIIGFWDFNEEYLELIEWS